MVFVKTFGLICNINAATKKVKASCLLEGAAAALLDRRRRWWRCSGGAAMVLHLSFQSQQLRIKGVKLRHFQSNLRGRMTLYHIKIINDTYHYHLTNDHQRKISWR